MARVVAVESIPVVDHRDHDVAKRTRVTTWASDTRICASAQSNGAVTPSGNEDVVAFPVVTAG